MTISERVFYRLNEIGMSQKEFSEQTGIAPSTISEWKSKRTNPTSEKIMIMCKVVEFDHFFVCRAKSSHEKRDISPKLHRKSVILYCFFY